MTVPRITLLLLIFFYPILAADTAIDDLPHGTKRRAKISTHDPELVGVAHYEIIDNLRIRMENEIPRNSHEVFEALSVEMIESLCDEDDFECESHIYREVLEGRELIQKINTPFRAQEHLNKNFPKNFSDESRWAIQNAMDMLNELDMKNIDHDGVINLMEYELKRLRETTTIADNEHKMVGIIALSVGLQSMKQWNEILNDLDHVFFQIPMIKYGDRRLQVTGGDGITGRVVNSDIVGASLGALIGISSGNKGLFYRTKRIIFQSIVKAVVGSVIGAVDLFIGSTSCPTPTTPTTPTTPATGLLFPPTNATGQISRLTYFPTTSPTHLPTNVIETNRTESQNATNTNTTETTNTTNTTESI